MVAHRVRYCCTSAAASLPPFLPSLPSPPSRSLLPAETATSVHYEPAFTMEQTCLSGVRWASKVYMPAYLLPYCSSSPHCSGSRHRRREEQVKSRRRRQTRDIKAQSQASDWCASTDPLLYRSKGSACKRRAFARFASSIPTPHHRARKHGLSNAMYMCRPVADSP